MDNRFLTEKFVKSCEIKIADTFDGVAFESLLSENNRSRNSGSRDAAA